MNQLHIKKGQPYPLGASSIRSNAINFSMVNNSQDDCGIYYTIKRLRPRKGFHLIPVTAWVISVA